MSIEEVCKWSVSNAAQKRARLCLEKPRGSSLPPHQGCAYLNSAQLPCRSRGTSTRLCQHKPEQAQHKAALSSEPLSPGAPCWSGSALPRGAIPAQPHNTSAVRRSGWAFSLPWRPCAGGWAKLVHLVVQEPLAEGGVKPSFLQFCVQRTDSWCSVTQWTFCGWNHYAFPINSCCSLKS